ncbi:Putative protein [Zobellia galactanivorans]|uniref:Uncharacterized protein n=1 Tax=Zobellia galactanivorans (strain DSM 12802 / CCUG 47099 / CIP 106680 / NCIMB 13871 / Dsij) TaxID=63186 RepID=G0L531_ZOBGA|nr:Putative protein [Zobellia galactanivorans]
MPLRPQHKPTDQFVVGKTEPKIPFYLPFDESLTTLIAPLTVAV